ncbi:histidine kinase [archaeon SCG-AAA382B04]|nr:histidine kinase [archaeon SCG-AAA382B04]
MNRQNKPERHDSRFVKRSLDRGPVEFKTRIPEKRGRVEKIGKKDVVTVPRSMTIIGAAKSMTEYGFRRLPVADPGTKKLEGIITSMDIVRLLGGGDYYQLIKKSHSGNLYSAINEGIREIMNKEIYAIENDDSIENAITTIVSTGTGGVPIVDKRNRVVGIITERDIVNYISGVIAPSRVREHMSRELVTKKVDSRIIDVTKAMIEEGFRRIPLVSNGELVGIVTATDIVKYLGSGNIFEKLKTGDVEEALDIGIEEIMSRDLVTLNKDAVLSEAAKLMTENNIGSIPILEDGLVVGLITEHDLVKSIVEE